MIQAQQERKLSTRMSEKRKRSRSSERRNGMDSASSDAPVPLLPSSSAAQTSAAPFAPPKRETLSAEVTGRLGGVYIPPFKLARLQKPVTDRTSPEFQRQSGDALRKSINGLVNKVNISNIAILVQELFRENLVRGRGLVARAIIRAQMASPGFTHVYAALLAVLNSKLPDLGDLVIRRVLLQFRRAYRRNDKIVCAACVKFLAHLVNQRVIHELLALQMVTLLLDQLTDDSVEVCVTFLLEVGQGLGSILPRGLVYIGERLNSILSEGQVDPRVQYTIEAFFEARRKKFADFPGVIPELDLVEEEDQVTHEVDLLDPDIKGEEMLNVFKAVDPDEFLTSEEAWRISSAEILGEAGDEGEEDEGASQSASKDSESEGEGPEEEGERTVTVKDMTEQDIINLRKTIYLTIMSSASFEECTHKILRMNIKEGCEIEVCTMLIDCCAMERTFQRFFALQGERLCKLKPVYQECFIDCLNRQYQTVHRLETKKLRNTAKFFAHLLYTDALPWQVLELFVITEEATTSASRIFIKNILQELAEQMGLLKLDDRLQEPALAPHLRGIFPTDHPKNTRFAINFFTAIGLGALTENLREVLSQSSGTIT